ncbi:MAG TPA: ABC transporter substrate-binding protein [Candidatus Limnocylindria bacterium]|nr:ABC transporter substrate-binding protein [Candidatus Limnocylindria bacterium]
MKHSRRWLAASAALMLVLSACGDNAGGEASDGGGTGELTSVRLQLQWVPQAQFGGYFAAQEQGYYEDEGLDVELVDGGPEVIPQQVGSAADGPEFTISWVPKVLQAREEESDLVNIAQIFQRAGTLSVAWADSGITQPADYAGKKVGVWDFGNELEVVASARAAGLEPGDDFEVVIQPFDMTLLLNAADGCESGDSDCVDVAEAMIYNEYAQLLETENPDTGELYQPEDLNVIDYNEVGTAMLQDALFARADWLAQEGNEDVAVRFLRASFKGWMYCRDNPDDCVQYVTDAGSTLGAGHQAWMMNEINALIWPSPDGIGMMSADLWDQTVETAITAEIIGEEPPDDAYRTDLAEQALADIEGDKTGDGFEKADVEVTPHGD